MVKATEGLARLRISVLALMLFSAGCASVRSNPSSNAGRPAGYDGGAVGQLIRDSSDRSSGPSQARAVTPVVSVVDEEVQGRKLKVNRFDYPVIINPAVEKWLVYFQGKGRKYFQKYLERGRFFIPEIAKVLKANGMPQDLVYLAMIESGFNNVAKSRARAVGPWQFIRATGVRYGLKVDFWLDERRDTRKATMAAIGYLKELYQEFGSWELAAAGYNAGEGKVRRAISKYRTNDFWEIARHRFFKHETRDYVPKIMAAAILTKNPTLFGFEDPFGGGKNPVLNPTAIMLADASEEIDSEELTPKELGEAMHRDEDTAEDPTEKVEKPSELLAEDDDGEDDDVLADEEHATLLHTPHSTLSPSVYMVSNPNEQILEFEVKGPADLFAIAKAAGLPYSTIKLLNPELLRWCTPPYLKSYRVKLPLSTKNRFLATYNDESFDRRVVFMRYTVRNGDSIQKVARRFSTESDPIRELNQLPGRSNSLRAGKSIVLPIPTGYKRVIASMYDDKPMPAVRKKRYRKRRFRAVLKRRSSSVSHHYRLRPELRPKQAKSRKTTEQG